jgi:hypothetical protein
MKNKRFLTIPAFEKRSESHTFVGMRVKTGVHAGAWRCTACAGQAIGSNLIKPKCDYCEIS